MNKSNDRTKRRSGWSAIAGVLLLCAAIPGYAQEPTQRQIDLCNDGDLNTCNYVGYVLEQGGRAGEAAPYFLLACDGGLQMACSNLGELFYEGRGVDQNYELALVLFGQACEGDVISGCAGVCLVVGQTGGLEPDMRGSCQAALDQSCSNGNAWMCDQTLPGTGSASAPPAVSQPAPEQNLSAQCEDGDLAACNNLGVDYDLAGDPVKAGDLYFRACDGGLPQACSNLAELLYDGRGIEQNYELAGGLFAEACAADIVSGCAGLCLASAQVGELEPDMRGSCQQMLNRACDEGNAWMCNQTLAGAGSASAPPAQPPAANQPVPDQALYARCDDGDLNACNEIGYYLDLAGRSSEAAPYVMRACDGGLMLACSNVAELLFEGRGLEQDYALAGALFALACESDVVDGCAGMCLVAAATGQWAPHTLGACRAGLDEACAAGNSWMCNRSLPGETP